MPALKNARHEAFAQALAGGKPASEAFVSAGHKESRSAASRLSAKVNIGHRVAEIVARVDLYTKVRKVIEENRSPDNAEWDELEAMIARDQKTVRDTTRDV